MLVKMSEYKQLGLGVRERVVAGRNRQGQSEYGRQRDTVEGAKPVGLEILPFTVEKRGNRFLCRFEKPGDVPFHFVRVYEDGSEERI